MQDEFKQKGKNSLFTKDKHMPVIISVIVSNGSKEEGKGMSKGEGVLFLVDKLGEREGEW